MQRWIRAGIGLSVAACLATAGRAADQKSAAQRGWDAVSRHAFNPPMWTINAYQNAWQQWGLKEKPADYDRAFREHYGLHSAPYDNDGLPMGLRYAQGLLGKGITVNCLLCHASSVDGKPVIGLGNSALDQEALFTDLFAGDRLKGALPFRVSHARGTVDPVAPVAFLMQLRDADLNVRKPVKLDYRNVASSRPPAWWQIKKKKTRDWNGGIDARSDRVDMAFLLTPLNSADFIKKQEPIFSDIREFVHNVPAPKYPFAVDAARAARGKEVFTEHCAKCHGTYGDKWTYPNKIVPLKTLGTDPELTQGFSQAMNEHYNRSWFAQQPDPDGGRFTFTDTRGYQAPPLDGVWATAPYFHNASAPTLYHVLNSKARPKYFTRSYRTGKADFDQEKVGWKYTALDRPADPKLPGVERRKVYDTTQTGLSNGGHTFGDELTEEQRWAVVEYLKTL